MARQVFGYGHNGRETLGDEARIMGDDQGGLWVGGTNGEITGDLEPMIV